MDMDSAEFKKIAEMIGSEDSPVGIDAKKTHVYIIHKLHQLEEKLQAMEDRLNQQNS